MPRQSRDIAVRLRRLGDGQVTLDTPVGEFYSPGESYYSAPVARPSRNMRFLNGVVARRTGYTTHSTKPAGADTDPITGLFFAVFDDGTSHLIRTTKDTMHSYVPTSWTDRANGGGIVFTSVTNADYWAFTMAPRSGSVNPKLWCIASDQKNELKRWAPGVAPDDFQDIASSPKGAVTVSSYLSRCFVANTIDGSGNRKGVRLHRSVIGDSTDWTGAGSGFVDLDADPWPIAKLAVMAGAQIVLKGDETGGSVWRGTPTGLVTEPVRYDAVNPGAGVGILLRRSFQLLAPGIAFFVGHDGLYLYDGRGSVKRVAEALVRTLLGRINQGSLDAAFTEYRPRTSEVLIHVATGAATTPNETWVFNLNENRTYGPYAYSQSLTTAAGWIDTGAITWDTFHPDKIAYPGTPVVPWDSLPWDSWDKIGGAVGALITLYGDSTGEVYQDSENPAHGDNGIVITSEYVTGSVTADGRVLFGARGDRTIFTTNDAMVLADVTLDYATSAAWTPLVEISRDDGLTWTTVSDGAQLAAGTGEVRQKTYTPQLSGTRFMARVSSTSRFDLHGLEFRFVHGGDQRHT